MPRRRPLSNIPVNIPSRRELSSEARSIIYGRALAEQSAREIEAKKYILKLTINNLLRRTE